jgi:hypothetical protein
MFGNGGIEVMVDRGVCQHQRWCSLSAIGERGGLGKIK